MRTRAALEWLKGWVDWAPIVITIIAGVVIVVTFILASNRCNTRECPEGKRPRLINVGGPVPSECVCVESPTRSP